MIAPTYFPSGTNNPGEIEGFAVAGLNVGATVSELRGGADSTLRRLAGTETLVFLDSGAYSDWFRALRDQCAESEVPFFLKQMHVGGRKVSMPELDGRVWGQLPERWA